MLGNVTSYNLSGADDRTAETTVCADAGFSETTVADDRVWRRLPGKRRRQSVKRRRQLAGEDAGFRRRRRSALAEATVCFGGCGDDSLQAQTSVCQAETAELRRRQNGDAKLWKPSFGGRKRQSGSRRRQSASQRCPNCGDDSSSAQTTLCVSRNAGRRVLEIS